MMDQVCIKACVVYEKGAQPYWLDLICFKTAGFTRSCTTYSSAILNKVGVREIGRRSLLYSSMCWFFGMGMTLAFFHIVGKHCFWKEELIR